MPLITEEQVKTLQQSGIKVPYVNEKCIGCSACASISSDVFEMTDEGKSEVIFLENYENLGVDDSIMACPVSAISWR